MKYQDILKNLDENPDIFPKYKPVISFADYEVSVYSLPYHFDDNKINIKTGLNYTWLSSLYMGRIKTPHGNSMIVLPVVKNDDWNNRGFGTIEQAQYASINVIAQMTKCLTPEKNIEVHMEYQ